MAANVYFSEVEARYQWHVPRDDDWYSLSRGERAMMMAYIRARAAIDAALMEKDG